MSLQAKTLLNLLAGAVAGFLAWVLTDATGWYAHNLRNLGVIGPGLPGYGIYLLYGAVFGLLLGLLLGIVDALSLDSQRQMISTLAWGSLIGFFGGALGLSLGQSVYGMLGGSDAASLSPGRWLVTLVARAAGWGVIGTIIGAAQGVSRRSAAIVRQGAFGGLAGGLIGGTVFQIAAELLSSDGLSRLAALVSVGALTGFFVGLVQNLFKQAWIRVMVGRNEGKEYLVAKPVLTIGRSELSDIGLFGDPSIAPTHAVIEALPEQNRHRLRHVAGGQGTHAFPPTIVNGRPVTAEQWLTDGDTIQIGQRTLLFEEKATRSAAAGGPTGSGAPQAASSTAARPPLAMPADVVAQMGVAPTAPAQSIPPLPTQSGLTAPFDSSSAGGTRLTALQGPYAGQSFALGSQTVSLGRSQDRDIALPADSSVSRTHARITYETGRHSIMDDGSSNGTLINNARLSSPRILRPGDIIQLGDTALRYE